MSRFESQRQLRIKQLIHYRLNNLVGARTNLVRIASFIFVILIGSFAGNLPAQTGATSTWPLTADQNAIVSGNLIATPQTLSNMQIYYKDGVQRSSISDTTAGRWPAETTENSARYMQFAVTPEEGYLFSLTSVTMYLYVNAGGNMRANVYYSTDPLFVTKTQIGSTFILSSTAPLTPNITAIFNHEVSYGDTFYVRVYPWYTTATTGKYVITNSVVISGTTMPSTCILISPLSLRGFVQEDAAIPSDSQNYYLSGMNLTDTVKVYSPPNFEISANSGSNWTEGGDSLRLPVSEGNIVGQPLVIAVRLKASSPGEYNGTIEHRSTGASNTIVNVSGVFLANEPTIASGVVVNSVTGKTADLAFSGGNGARRVVAIRAGTEILWLPEDGQTVGTVTANFMEGVGKFDGTKIVYDGQGSSVTITGLTSNTIYTVAVFEYNVATGNTQNYLTTQSGSVTFATAIVPELGVLPTALNFGSVLVSHKMVKSYALTGHHLIENNLINVTAPPGFDLSLSPDTGFVSLLQVAYTSSTFDTTIYVSFTPTESGIYSGIITNTEGSDTVDLAVTGRGVYTLVQTTAPVGFATLDGGTNGGMGGDSVVVTTAEQLFDLMHARENKSTAPLVVYISGTISGYSTKISVKRTANISIIGLGSDAGLNGFGMKIVECSNIIVRNLTFADCHVDEEDALGIEESRNVWIDHCTFTDSPANDPAGSNHDGLLDIKNGSCNVTVSYNHFTNHRQTCLLGHTKDQVSDTVMTVTYYRNWFDGTYSRHPRIRFAKVHIVNNLYTNIGSYGVGVTCDAQVLVEANHFENVPVPVLISQINDPGETLSGDPAGSIKAVDNFTATSGTIVENLAGYYFDPNNYYSYDVVPASMVKTLVMENAGAGMLDTTTQLAQRPDAVIPADFLLMQNFPNPFNPTTLINFELPTGGLVKLTIFDLLGKEVRQVLNEYRAAGFHSVLFDAANLPGGIYFYRLQVGNFCSTRKMILLK
jgi:pectate lyase